MCLGARMQRLPRRLRKQQAAQDSTKLLFSGHSTSQELQSLAPTKLKAKAKAIRDKQRESAAPLITIGWDRAPRDSSQAAAANLFRGHFVGACEGASRMKSTSGLATMPYTTFYSNIDKAYGP